VKTCFERQEPKAEDKKKYKIKHYVEPERNYIQDEV
jgi:hypothetical protein